jgi:restriction endonuclease S subunit
LESYSGGVTTIDALAGQIANGAEVREYLEEGVAYLRVGDLKNLTIDASSVVRIDPASAEKGLEKIDLQTGDVLVSRSGSLAVTAVVEPEWADALISSHLIRLRIIDRRIDPYYLALFLGALPGKMQIQQRSNGGVQPEINQPALKSILVPIPPQCVQQEIRRLILSARELRDLSNNLLDVARRAVEIAIEQDEEAAIDYIKQKGQL